MNARTPEEIADAVYEKHGKILWAVHQTAREALIEAAKEAQKPADAARDVASLAATHADRLEAAWESGDLASAVRDAIGDLRVIAATLKGEDA